MKRILAFLFMLSIAHAIVVHTYSVLPNEINETLYSTVVQHVYLKNLSGDIIKYPKIGGTYKCWVDTLAPDNDSLLSVKWYTVGPGISAQSGVDAVKSTDGVSYYTAANLTPTTAGNLECDITVIDSNLATKTFEQTFVVTTPVPSCTHDDYCTMSGTQTYANSDSAVTSRYENLTIASGATLNLPHVATTTTYIVQTVNIKVDNYLEIAGTITGLGTNSGVITNCGGGAVNIQYIYARNFNLTGTIQLTGGTGVTSCTSNQAAGGDVGNLEIHTINGYQTGTIKMIGGAPGSRVTSSSSADDSTATVGRLRIYAYENYTFVGGIINQTGGDGVTKQNADSTCSQNKSPGGNAGGYAQGVFLASGAFYLLSGNIYIHGGDGGDAPTNTHCSQSGSLPCAGNGGEANRAEGGISSDIVVNDVVWDIAGGKGGTGAGRAPGSTSIQTIGNGNGGRATKTVNIHYNLTDFSQPIALTGGAAGDDYSSSIDRCTSGTAAPQAGTAGTTTAHTLTYVHNTGDTLSTVFTPTSTITQDTSIAHTGPNATLNFTAPLINTDVGSVSNMTLEWAVGNETQSSIIEVSTNNKTWYPVYGVIANPPYSYLGAANLTNASLSINRETSSVYFRGRLRNSYLYTPWDYTFINATTINTNISGVRVPAADPVTQSYIDFYCNYSREDNNQSIQSAGVYINIDGTNYSASFVVADQTYYYRKTNATLAGTNNWTCVAERPNFNLSTSENYTYEYGDYIVELPSGYDDILLTCPFPTIYSMVPAGQKAHKGIIRVSNNVVSTLTNYSIMLNQSAPGGMSIYGRCDKMVSGTSLTGWSSINASTPFACWQNVNSTNASAYLWIKANCVGSATGTHDPFNYIVYEDS